MKGATRRLCSAEREIYSVNLMKIEHEVFPSKFSLARRLTGSFIVYCALSDKNMLWPSLRGV